LGVTGLEKLARKARYAVFATIEGGSKCVIDRPSKSRTTTDTSNRTRPPQPKMRGRPAEFLVARARPAAVVVEMEHAQSP
jgi:hypothetical protein